MGYLFAAAIVIAGAWSLWARRLAVGNQWETATTQALVLIIVGSVLISPVLGAQPLEWLHRLTGLWNLEALLGGVFILAGITRICQMLIRRVEPEPGATRYIRRWVHAPTAITLAAAWLGFAIGGAGTDPHALSHTPPMGPINVWIKSYWIALAISIIYLTSVAIRYLLILRTEPRHRPVATLYLIACLGGMALGVLSVTGALIGHRSTPVMIGSTIAFLVWLGGYIVVAAYSWRRKTAPFNSLIQATRRS